VQRSVVSGQRSAVSGQWSVVSVQSAEDRAQSRAQLWVRRVRGVFDVAEADAHVAVDGVGDGHGEGHAEDAVGERERIEIPIAKEEPAGDGSPERRDHEQNRIGDVGEGEEDGGERDGGGWAQAEAEEAGEDVDLQDELLHEGPEGVSPEVGEDGQRAIEAMEGVQVAGECDGGEAEDGGDGDDPEGGQETAEAEAVGVDLFAAEDGGDGDPGEGGPVEDALGGVGGPDDDEDEAVADGELEKVEGEKMGGAG